MGELRKRIRQATSAHVVDRQDRVANGAGALPLALCACEQPALVDNLLGAALNLRVATLHRVEIQRHRIGAGGHGAGSTAAHADPHARPAELDQQATRRERDLVRLGSVDGAEATRQHDGLVVTTLHRVHVGRHRLLVLPEVAQ